MPLVHSWNHLIHLLLPSPTIAPTIAVVQLTSFNYHTINDGPTLLLALDAGGSIADAIMRAEELLGEVAREVKAAAVEGAVDIGFLFEQCGDRHLALILDTAQVNKEAGRHFKLIPVAQSI